MTGSRTTTTQARALAPSAAAMDEDALVRGAHTGDRAAFGALYRRYRDPLYRFCLRKLGNVNAAEDAVQDTFVKAFANIGHFEVGRPMWPWLTTIAEHACIDLYRRTSKRTSPVEDVSEVSGNQPEDDEAKLDPTCFAILDAERWRELNRAMRKLPTRQRRALLLFALDGWNYADIAAAEQVSVSSVKSLIFRARFYLRQAYESGPLAVILLPLEALRRRLELGAAKVRVALSQVTPESAYVAVQSFTFAVLALTMLVSPGMGTLDTAHGSSSRPSPVVIPAESGAAALSGGSGPRADPGHAKALGANRVRGSLDEPAGYLEKELLDPGKDATPEDTRFTSVVSDPAGRTILAGGTVSCQRAPCTVLFVSNDGGASWEKLRAVGYEGGTLLMPPGFPGDERIFAIGASGLQQSPDGGDTFQPLVPLSGGAAIAPGFARDDPRILLGGATISEYWADRGTIRPATLLTHSRLRSEITFSPAYADGDPTVFVGAEHVGTGDPIYQSVVYRCEGSSACSSRLLPGGFGVPALRPAADLATSGRVFAFTSYSLFVSRDSARTFSPVELPTGEKGTLADVALASGGADRAAIYAALSGASGGIYRSFDDGSTWFRLPLDLPAFKAGAVLVVTTASGRLLAASPDRGIACSVDGGGTWLQRCPRQL